MPVAASMRSSDPDRSRAHTAAAPDVMLTGPSCWPRMCSVLMIRLVGRSTPTTLPVDQSEIQAVEPSSVMLLDWLTGRGIRASTVAANGGGVGRTLGAPARRAA